MKIDIETLRKTKGIGSKTLERIIEQHNLDNELKAYKSNYKPSETYKVDKDINLWQGDCIELMEHIPDKSVDMVLCDLPYGTTACSWDTIIPFEPLWDNYKRIIKDNGAIVLFGTEPFSTKLRSSNINNFKYEWVWEKQKGANFMGAKYSPIKYHENIVVFGKTINSKVKYYPQKTNVIELEDILNMNKKELKHFMDNRLYDRYGKIDRRRTINNVTNPKEGRYGKMSLKIRNADDGTRFPKSVIKINKSINKNLHPTQKPVALLEYLIKTYTNEGETVLDNCMGSGSTGVACVNTNRKFIGIELDENYFEIAKERIENTV